MSWPWDVFDAAGDVLAATLALPWVIFDGLINLVMVCFYPFIVVVSIIQTVFLVLWQTLAAFLNTLIEIPNMLIDLINALFIGTLPFNWLALISIQLFIVLGLRLYGFLKDVEILGNKI
jgi:hypothetical protein